MKSALVLTLLFSIISACSRLQNGTDRLSVECQVLRNSTGRYLKVIDSSSLPYDREANKRLKAAMAVDGSSNTHSLSITNGGCVQLPDTSGIVTVVDGAERWSATLPIQASKDTSPQIQTIQLQPLKDFSLGLACPAEGLFADSSLQVPESLVLGGDMGGLEFHIELYKDKQFVRRIFEKKIGQGSFLHNSEVSVADLPEGAYTLKLYGRHVANGIDTQLALLNADRDCNLYVLHGEVKVKGVSDSSFFVVAKGSNLNWRAEKFGEQLFLCRESREGKYTPTTAGACQAQAYCQNEDHFARVDEVLAQDAGVFDYYVFAKDQLGRKSPLSCQTLIVSETKPSLSVTWDAADLKPAGSILRKPYATIRAHAAVDHGLLDAKGLAKNLECKVSFELRGRDELSGKSVYCTEGRCKGMSMGDYVPCDPSIAFSLVEAWDQPVTLSSLLRLHVRSSDGAGHSADAEASFWINKTTWQTDVIEYVEDGSSLNLSDFAITRTGVILGLFGKDGIDGNRFVRYVNGSWQKFAELKHYVHVRFVRASQQNPSANVFYYDQDEVFRNEFWEFADDGTVARKTSTEHMHGNCQYFSADRHKNLWCFDTELVQYFADGSWHELPDMKSLRPDPSASLATIAWRVAQDGRVFGLAANYLVVYTPQQGWVRLDTKDAFEGRTIVGWVEDTRGRIWLIADRSAADIDAVYRLNPDNTFSGFFAPQSLGFLVTPEALADSPPLANLHLGFYTFDFEKEAWFLRPGLHDKPSPGMGFLLNYLRYDGRTNLGFENHGFYEDQDEPLYWSMQGSCSNCWTSAQHFSSSEFFYASNFRLYRNKTISSAKFDGSIFPIQGNYASDNWIDTDGVPLFVLSDSTVIRLTGNGVETSPIKLPTGTMRAYPLANGRICSSTFKSVSIIDRNSKIEKAFPLNFDLAYHCTEDHLGRLWFHLAGKYGYATDDYVFHPIVDLQPQQEYLSDVTTFNGGRLIVLGSDHAIRLVDAEDLTIRELTPPVNALTWTYDRISSHEFLLWFNIDEKTKKAFVLDANNWSFTEDKVVETFNIVGTGRPQIRGDKAWFIALDPEYKAVLLTREGGQWQMLATLNQFKPWSEVPAPSTFAPDLSGHIWFISSSPNYEFYRYDP